MKPGDLVLIGIVPSRPNSSVSIPMSSKWEGSGKWFEGGHTTWLNNNTQGFIIKIGECEPAGTGYLILTVTGQLGWISAQNLRIMS